MVEQGWLVDDFRQALRGRSDLVEDVLGRALVRFSNLLIDEALLSRLPGDGLEIVHGDPRIPRFQHVGSRALSHRFAVGRDGFHRGFASLRILKAAPPRSDDKARGEPLEVPFERCGQSLVEIVDVESERALGRGEAAEIHRVTVAAGLNDDSARRRAGEVVGLQAGRASIERERGLQHSAMADGHQIFQAVLVGICDKRDDVALVTLPEHDLAVRRARAFVAQFLACLHALFGGAKNNFCHVDPLFASLDLTNQFQPSERLIPLRHHNEE